MISSQKSNAYVSGVNFHANFKSFIGFRLTFFKSARRTSFLRIVKRIFFGNFTRLPIFMETDTRKRPLHFTQRQIKFLSMSSLSICLANVNFQ